MVCTHVEDNEGFVFIVPPSKRNQLPIVFGGIRPQTTASKDSNEDLEPSQFFHYTRLAYRMMRRIEYNLRCGDCLNFRKGQRIPLQPFLSKEKPAKYYDQTYRELGYVTPPNKSESEINKSPLSYSSSSSNWESDVSVGVTLKNLFANMMSISQVEQDESIEPFDTDPWTQQLDFQWEKRFEQREPPTEDKVIQVDVGDQAHPRLISIARACRQWKEKTS